MTATSSATVFGLRLGVDPKVVFGILFSVSVAIFWYNSHYSQEAGPTYTSIRQARSTSSDTASKDIASQQHRRPGAASLSFRTVDGSRGDVDPRLRIDLLARLQHLPAATRKRSVFEVVEAPAPPEITTPVLLPPPAPSPLVASVLPPSPAPPPTTSLKYYGFTKSISLNEPKEGFFLDGDAVLIAGRGDVLQKRYKVLVLTSTSAELQDLELAKSLTLTAPEDNKQ